MVLKTKLAVPQKYWFRIKITRIILSFLLVPFALWLCGLILYRPVATYIGGLGLFGREMMWIPAMFYGMLVLCLAVFSLRLLILVEMKLTDKDDTLLSGGYSGTINSAGQVNVYQNVQWNSTRIAWINFYWVYGVLGFIFPFFFGTRDFEFFAWYWPLSYIRVFEFYEIAVLQTYM